MKKNDNAVFDERLNCDSIDVKPINYDWSEGYPEKWEYHEAVECEKCGKAIVLSGGGEARHHEVEADTDCDGYLNSDGPMMNYYYPLPDFKMDTDEAAKKIVHLPLCIVHFLETDEYALALTGGGMDLSWEICAAFIELGYHPPVHFRLPEFAGGPNIGVERAKRVIAAMRESIQISQNWRNADMADVNRAEAYIKGVEKSRKKEKPKGK
jgi:hypothetical protein